MNNSTKQNGFHQCTANCNDARAVKDLAKQFLNIHYKFIFVDYIHCPSAWSTNFITKNFFEKFVGGLCSRNLLVENAEIWIPMFPHIKEIAEQSIVLQTNFLTEFVSEPLANILYSATENAEEELLALNGGICNYEEVCLNFLL